MRRIIILIVAAALILSAGFGCTKYHTAGALVGGAVGGIAGALIDRGNPLRGAAIGAALGAASGAAWVEISTQAVKDAARENRPVRYEERKEGKVIVAEATPVGKNPRNNCKRIHNRVIEDGKVIADNVQEVCN